MSYPKVLSEFDTLERAKTHSIARYGDGECRLAIGKDCISQRDRAPGLEKELRHILREPKNCLVCIPNIFSNTPKKENWAAYATQRYADLYGPHIYGSSFITRPDSAPWIDTPEYWDSLRDLWRGKDITLVVGDKKSLTAEELTADGARVREVTGPRINAYVEADRIMEEIGTPAGTVILCLGATATVLAYRLAQKGVHALDLGHVGMFMRHAGAYRFTADDLLSKHYRKQLTSKHGAKRWGKDGHSHAPEIIAFADEIGAESILDYGCGTGTLATKLALRKVQEYDPGIMGKDKLPKPADLVCSTDVLEHIEPDRLDAVLQHQYRLSAKGCYLVIALTPAREILDDGRNAHLIVRPVEWWLEKLRAVGWREIRHEKRKGLCVWLTK